jgi:hypothetical protein
MVLPYLKGFLIIKWWFYILFLYIHYGVFVFNIWYLTIGIRAISLAKEGNIFFLFLQSFSREEKEGDALQVHI